MNAKMLHHVSFCIADLQRSQAFYDAALGALGFVRVFTGPGAVAYGFNDGEEDQFLLNLELSPGIPQTGFHLAFAAPSQSAVDEFYAQAIAHGGTSNGAPGFRPNYGNDYYAAFVIDPDGYHVEAVINGN